MNRVSIPHRRKALLLALGAVALVLTGLAVGFVVLLSGAYTTAATRQHFSITYAVLDRGLTYAVRAAAADIEPPDLRQPEMIRQGLACYRQFCVQCHGAPGVARDELGKGMLPSPSSLAQSGREWPAAHLYYVTKKGVRMAGMPAWEFRISEQGLWSTVAFLKQMPFLTRVQYEQMHVAAEDETCPRNVERTADYSRERAMTLLRQYACDNCHRFDGMVGPDAHVGPPLTQWAGRKYIAGVLPNTQENLVKWIVRPQAISPDTMMPDLHVPEAHAREMTAYLMEAE